MHTAAERKGKRMQIVVCTQHNWRGLGKNVVMCSAPPNGCRDIQHPTWRRNEKFLSGDQVVRGRSLHTTRSIAQIFVGVVLDVSSHLYNYGCGSDCI
jgi:hypothetical protein